VVIFSEIFGEARSIWIVSEGCLMSFKTCGVNSTSLLDVRFVAIQAGDFE